MTPIRSNPHEWDDWSDEGYVGFVGHAVLRDPLNLTDAEQREERKRQRKALQRKRPVGLAPWPEEDRNG